MIATDTLETRYGTLVGVSNFSTYPDGSVMSCILNAENRIDTPVGTVIPQYREAEHGERNKKYRSSLEFFENGRIKTVSLDQPMPIKTPLGVFDAELVTFHEEGSVRRLFPLNGKVDGFWSEKREGEMAKVLNFDLPVGKFSAKIINLNFYPAGALKSLTLWPGQKVVIDTPVGPMKIRKGFSLYENGSVRSVEPMAPFALNTPIGVIKAFDAEMLGMNADQNCIQFTPTGAVLSVKTVHSGLRVVSKDGVEKRIEPLETASLIEMTAMRTVPMVIAFEEGKLAVIAKDAHSIDLAVNTVTTFDRSRVIREMCSSCAGCDGGDNCCRNS